MDYRLLILNLKKSMRITIFIILLIISMSHCASSQTLQCNQNANDPDLQTISQFDGTDTITREYILKIPTNYNKDISTPLIINMHGFGDCASDYANTIHDFYNFSQLANNENIIVVYPQGAYRPDKQDTYWEPGDTGIENIYDNDIFFIEELIAKIKSEYNINQDMIFACGYSNGGMMSYSLACNRSNIFSAIGIMSGTMLEEECTLEKPVPTIKFHGIADGVLPYNGNVWFQSVNEVVSFWLSQNNIPNTSLNSSQLNSGNVIHNAYTGGIDNSCVSVYTINEEFDKPGGHVWFSGDINGKSPNEIMWNFFVQNCSVLSSAERVTTSFVKMFPNPIQNEIKLSNAMNKYYILYDVHGKRILSGIIKSNLEHVDTANLNSGYYILRIGDQISKILKLE